MRRSPLFPTLVMQSTDSRKYNSIYLHTQQRQKFTEQVCYLNSCRLVLLLSTRLHALIRGCSVVTFFQIENMYRLSVIGGLLTFLVCVTAHTYHLGACPIVEPMTGFEMNKMLGIWYVIQKTSTASHCITYNFSRTDEPGKYELEQVSQHFLLGLTPLEHDYRYKGVLTIPDPAVPARMKVRFPLSVAGSASYTVLMTDYTTHAAIFTCQKLAFAHRRSATILSRTKELDKMYVDKMRNKLASFGVDPYDLSIISQSECPKHPNGTEGVNININPGTFSSHNIGEAVRQTGSVIADGVEYVVEAGKKVYHKVTDSKEDLTETPGASHGNSNGNGHRLSARPDDDAEWLP